MRRMAITGEGVEFLPVDGYDSRPEYVDADGWEISFADKTLDADIISAQTLIAGEKNADYIYMTCPRKYDGIDLGAKNIEILYVGPSGYSDTSVPVNVYVSDTMLTFGWVVPEGALLAPGELMFSVQFFDDNYRLKLQAVFLPVLDGMSVSDIMPEPVEKEWYLRLTQRCNDGLSQAKVLREEIRELEKRVQEELVEITPEELNELLADE